MDERDDIQDKLKPKQNFIVNKGLIHNDSTYWRFTIIVNRNSFKSNK